MEVENNNSLESSLRYNRADNVTRIAIWRTVAIIIITIGPFLLRSVLIREMGMEILGLQSFFQTVLNTLNIAEMGFSQAMVFFLLKPLAEGDHSKVNEFLAAMRKIYIFMGGGIIIAGLCLIPFIKFFVKSDVLVQRDILTFYVAFIISGTMYFFFFMETITLLNSLQRLDIYYWIVVIINTCEYIAQALAIIVFHSYILYIMIIGIAAILAGILRKIITHKLFPEFRPEGSLSRGEYREIKKKTISVFGHQLDETLINSIDNIFITSFLGLSAVASYGNYFYVITAVTMFIDIIFSSLFSAIGNALITEEKESNIFRFRCVFWLNAIIVGWATCCMFNLYQGFIYLWVGDHLLGMDMVILFCVYFYISQMRKTVLLFKNAAGMWDQDALKPYISMGMDIFLDIVLIYILGMKGAIISSILCLVLIEIPWETVVLFKQNLKLSIRGYLWSLLRYSFINVIVIILSTYVCSFFLLEQGIIMMLLRLIVCTIICSTIDILFFWKNELVDAWIKTIKLVTKL